MLVASRFIVLEGIDGSGISTQIEALRVWCERQSVKVYVTKEPSDGPIGAQLKAALTHRITYSADVMALLFAADRLDHLENDVLPRLKEGINVISDRYYLSSFAYQGEDVPMARLRMINSPSPRPDITLFLDVPVEECLKRWSTDVWRSHDRLQLFEKEDILRSVRESYLNLIGTLRKEGERIEVIDGRLPIEDVSDVVINLAKPFLLTKPEDSTSEHPGSRTSEDIPAVLRVPPGSET